MATNVALHQLLGSTTVTRAISQIKTPMSRLQDFFGAGPGGPNTNQVGGKNFGWDIFDRTRSIATGRPPGTGPATIAPQVVGHVSAAAYRAHEKITLLEERIFRTRPIGGQWGEVDVRGQAYVTRQEQYIAQRFRNSRELMLAAMLRGQLYLTINGDDLVPTLASGDVTIDFKIPAGNKSQLDLTGAGSIIGTSWDTDADTDGTYEGTIVDDCLDINSAFEQLHGYPLRHVWVNSTLMKYVMNTAQLQNVAGTANRVFTLFQPTGLTNDDGVEDTGFNVVFEAMPWLTWHVYDGGLDVNGTFTKLIADSTAIFMPDPDPNWFEMLEGSEVVAENVMDAGNERFGLQAWTTRVIDPAGFDLKALDVCLPALYIPKCIAYGTVIFT